MKSTGEWFRPYNSGTAHPLLEIERDDRKVLVFDPPNILFLAGGQRIRMVDYDTDTPTLEVETFERDKEGNNVIIPFKMKVKVPTADEYAAHRL